MPVDMSTRCFRRHTSILRHVVKSIRQFRWYLVSVDIFVSAKIRRILCQSIAFYVILNETTVCREYTASCNFLPNIINQFHWLFSTVCVEASNRKGQKESSQSSLYCQVFKVTYINWKWNNKSYKGYWKITI